ncbi:hypothetical protein QI239_06455 [Staphylococcus saprophyticus]|nr:hypothetical protein [Staphylococcus saprophyticus]
MNITYLQKLDFLLKNLESRADVKKYKIYFGLNNQVYTGEFIQGVNKSAAIKKDVTNFNCDVFNYVNLEDRKAWKKLFEVHNDLFNPDYTDFEFVRSRSNILKSHEYLQLLDVILGKYLISLEDGLLPYIYNVKNLTIESPINFMKVDEDTDFDFVSLLPENAN